MSEEFHTYHKIKVIGSLENKEIFEDPESEIIVQEKLDGCFNYNMKVKTDKGMLSIGKIVNKKLNVKVLSVDKNGKKSFQKIKNYYNHGKSNNWVKLFYDYHNKERYLIVTDNHIVFTNNGLKQVKDLDLENDYLISEKEKFNSDQEQIIIGSILGDMSCRNMNHKTKNLMFSETHGIKQENYLKWKKKYLKNFVSNEDYHESAYDEKSPLTKKYRIYSISTPELKRFEFLYENGDKKIPKDINKYLSSLSIAVWYMDDGSCSFSNKQKSRITFHTQSFTEKEVGYLRNALLEFGVESKQHNYKGWQIDVTAKGTEILLKMISKYIPLCMQYKLPKIYKRFIFTQSLRKHSLVNYLKIKKIKKYNPVQKIRYDLEIEKNHNYFVKGVLVHNSNFRYLIKDNKVIFGSRGRELGSDTEEKNFKRCLYFIKGKLEGKDLTPYEGMTFFGECIVRHTISYNWEVMPPFLGFDILLPDGNFMNYPEVMETFEKLDLPFVPIIKFCKAKDITVIDDSIVPKSFYASLSSEDQLAEGLVFKNYGKQIFGKYVRNKFKEENHKVFGGGKKYAENDNEYIVAVYCTNARIDKCVFKLLDDGKILDMKLMPDLIRAVINDVYEEHWRDIVYSQWNVNFKNLRNGIARRCMEVLKQSIVNNSLV